MKKITISNVTKISNKLAETKSSFFVNPFYLLENCYFEEKNGEIIVGQLSAIKKRKVNYINVTNAAKNGDTFTLLSDDEIRRLDNMGIRILEKTELGIEFFYKTADYLKLEGGEFSRIRKRINKLNKKFQVKVLDTYDKTKVIDFIDHWSKSKNTMQMQERETRAFKNEIGSTIKALDQLEKIENKSYFLEINNKLVGFRITVPQNNDTWVGVFQKIDHSFEGLNELLYQVSSKDYQAIPWFTTGAAGGSDGLENHKRNMHPKREKRLYFVKTLSN